MAKDYKFIQFDEVTNQVDFPKQEEEILSFWKAEHIFSQSVNQRSEERNFHFYDGPPFATGLPHYGHLLASIIKDVVPRYWTMRGYRVERRFGWDCHGLPVENEVEQQLNLSSRSDILSLGVDRFNETCRDVVLRYSEEWECFINRVGRWVDWSNQYRTMDPDFMESVWWVFKTLWDKKLIYEGYKSLAYCPRCATPLSNFEVNQGYKDTQDPSVTVKFKICEKEDLYILAWTTTPWTLSSNMGLAIGRDIKYVRVHVKGGKQLILAEARIQDVFKRNQDDIVRIESESIDKLIGLRYEPLFPYFSKMSEDGAFRVVEADFVSTENGTGVVHVAPGFGEDDYVLGQREGLPVVAPIDEDCCFTDEIIDYSGRFVKDVDRDIIRHLRDREMLFAESTIEHSYPFCWRCDSPLIYRAVSTWFVNVEKIKDQMLEANKQIWWVPEHIKDGRFGKWLEGARDWAISRNRYWGTPLPIWRNEETGELLCIGSREELERLSGRTIKDLHKHVIDQIEIDSSNGKEKLRRVPEVLDCWFESGSMPYAQNHYPFENKNRVEANFPADFISEGLDQTRGWFYTLTVLSAALFNKPAFKNCIVSGMLLAEDGRKMSKRLKNYPEPTVMIDKYGADALRLYLLNSPALKAEELRLTEEGIQESLRSVIIPLWNAYSFFVTYANIDEWQPNDRAKLNSENPLDSWIISELQTLLRDLNIEMESYRLYRTVPAMVAFVEKLTNWYIRRSRRRFWKSDDDDDKAFAYDTLYYVLVTFCKALAPVLPFVTESIYRNLVCKFRETDPVSIHLCDMPQANESLRDEGLESQMNLATRAVVLGRSLRSKNNLKIRQPLRRLYLLPPDKHSSAKITDMMSLLADELNIKDVVLVEDETQLSKVSYKPNFRRLGPRFGKRIKEVAMFISNLKEEQITDLLRGEKLSVAEGDIDIEDLEVQREEKEGVVVAIENNFAVGLDIHLDDELIGECTAREFVNRVQNMRKDAEFQVSDRIEVWVRGTDELLKVIDKYSGYISGEILANKIHLGDCNDSFEIQQEWNVNGFDCDILLSRK